MYRPHWPTIILGMAIGFALLKAWPARAEPVRDCAADIISDARRAVTLGKTWLVQVNRPEQAKGEVYQVLVAPDPTDQELLAILAIVGRVNCAYLADNNQEAKQLHKEWYALVRPLRAIVQGNILEPFGGQFRHLTARAVLAHFRKRLEQGPSQLSVEERDLLQRSLVFVVQRDPRFCTTALVWGARTTVQLSTKHCGA